MLPNHLHLKEVSVVLGVVIFLLSTVNSAVPRIGSCPILTGRLPVPLPALQNFYFELQKSTIVPSSLLPSCVTINVHQDTRDKFLSNVVINFRDSLDGKAKTLRGTMENAKPYIANGNFLPNIGSDFLLTIKNSPVQLLPTLTKTTQFPFTVLNYIGTPENGGSIVILYFCEDLGLSPFIPLMLESIWVLGTNPTLSDQGRQLVLEQLRRFSIDYTFLKNSFQGCSVNVG